MRLSAGASVSARCLSAGACASVAVALADGAHVVAGRGVCGGESRREHGPDQQHHEARCGGRGRVHVPSWIEGDGGSQCERIAPWARDMQLCGECQSARASYDTLKRPPVEHGSPRKKFEGCGRHARGCHDQSWVHGGRKHLPQGEMDAMPPHGATGNGGCPGRHVSKLRWEDADERVGEVQREGHPRWGLRPWCVGRRRTNGRCRCARCPAGARRAASSMEEVVKFCWGDSGRRGCGVERASPKSGMRHLRTIRNRGYEGGVDLNAQHLAERLQRPLQELFFSLL